VGIKDIKSVNYLISLITVTSTYHQQEIHKWSLI